MGGEGERPQRVGGMVLPDQPSLILCPLHPSRLSLTDLEKGIQGLIVMSTSLEEIFNCIFDAHVPPLWGKASSPHCQSQP